MEVRYVILKNTEGKGTKTAAFKIEGDSYYLGTVNDPYDVNTFEKISGRKTDQIIGILNYILLNMNNNNDTATIEINRYDYDALRQAAHRLFRSVDQNIGKQFESAIDIRSNEVVVNFRNIFQESREVSSILKKEYGKRDRIGFDFLISCGAHSERIEEALKNNQLTIVRSVTGGIGEALLSSAFRLAEDEHKNVIYLEKIERNVNPLFNAIKNEYKLDLMVARNVQIYILINLQNNVIVSDNYLIEGLFEDVKVLLQANPQVRIVVGYKDTKTIEDPLKRILNTDNKDINTLEFDQTSLKEFFDKNDILRPEDENISQLLETNMDFLCFYALNYRENSDLDKLLLHLDTEDIIKTYSDGLNREDRNNITFFSVVTSILYEHGAMDTVFTSQDFNEETIKLINHNYPFYSLNTLEDYCRVGRFLNAMTKEGWVDSTDNYYIARGIIDRIHTGDNIHGVLQHLESKLHKDKPESSDLLTARFLVDGLSIKDEKNMDDVLKKIQDKEDKILFTAIFGRLLDHFETIRNSKKYIADRVQIAIKYLRTYWDEERDKEDLENLLVSLCYGALQTQDVVSDETYLSLCKTSEENLQFIIDTGYFDRDDLPAKAEKSRIKSNLGASYLAMGKALMKDESKHEESRQYLNKALSAHQCALELRDRIIKENPEILEIEPGFISKRYTKSLTNIATCYYWLGDNEKSEEYHEKAQKADEESGIHSVLSCIRLGGTLLEGMLSKKQVLRIVQLFRRASSLMEKNPGQNHAEIQNLQKNYLELIEKLKNERSLLCHCVFDLLDLATDVDRLYYSEYYIGRNACKYLTLRVWISPVEKLFDIYKIDINNMLDTIKNRNNDSEQLRNAMKLAENPSASLLSDAEYVNACHFILNNCFDYRWKMKVIKGNATKIRVGEEDKTNLELVKPYFDSVMKMLNPSNKEIRWRYQEKKDNPELSNIMEQINSTRQSVIDDETAKNHREEIIEIIKEFDLLKSSDKVDSEFENIKKGVIICPLGATTNAIYNRTKAANDLFTYFIEKKKVPSVTLYGLGSEKTDSIDCNDFAKLAKEKGNDILTWSPKDPKPNETDVMLYALKHLHPEIEMKRVSTRDARSDRYIQNVNSIYTSKDGKLVIASFHKKSSNTHMQTYHVLNKFKSDYCLIFVSTSIYRDFTISVIRRNMKELGINAEIRFFGTEYRIEPGDSVCKAIQEIKVGFDEIIKTYE